MENFTLFLQSCITPVALISGVGLLLLSITNRLGRTIDRVRVLVDTIEKNSTLHVDQRKKEIKILFKRCRLLRNSVALIVFSIISSSAMIPVLFLMSLFDLNLKIIGYGFFSLSICSIIISVIYLMLDVLASLEALKIEAQDYI